jgi:hypothetical protein
LFKNQKKFHKIKICYKILIKLKETINKITLMAKLFDSVAPLVKTISLAFAPMRLATCYNEKTTYNLKLQSNTQLYTFAESSL